MNNLPIQLLDCTFDTATILAALTDQNCTLWNQHSHRTRSQTSPHYKADDIWARYEPFENVQTRTVDGPFVADWYQSPITDLIKQIVDSLYVQVNGVELGGVLITRIKAHNEVKRHIDQGWHAGTYSKYCVCIQANLQQRFSFENASVSCETGNVFWFDNSFEHWVTNPSDEDRISMICCIKTNRGIHQP